MFNPITEMATILKQAVDLYNVSNFCDIVKKQLLNNSVTGMDSGRERFNRESVRKTLMKQEETFKEQVRELHRVYRAQKMLMAELRNHVPQLHSPTEVSSQRAINESRCIDVNNRTGFWTAASTSETDQAAFSCWNRSSTNEPSPGYNLHSLFSMRADSSQQEQSSSCSRETPIMPKVIDSQQPVAEVSTDDDQTKLSIDSTSEPCLYNDGDGEVELTLSIGFGTRNNKSKHRKPHLNREIGCSSSNYHQRRQSDPCLSVRSDSSEATNTTGSVTATCDREGRQQPPWLFQSLSLHRT